MRFFSKILFLFLFFFTVPATTKAQEGMNLVPNPSFEEYEDCPFSTGELQNQVIDWYSWQETPDFFHECSNDLDGFAGVPENAWGYQEPITGIAYACLATFASVDQNTREYIAVQLTQPMVEGQDYYVVFYASMWDGWSDSHLWCASNHIGLRFFLNPTYNYQTNPLSPDNFAHVDYENVLNDNINWTKIEGWVHADQPYNWLAIGNFFTDENTEIEVLNDSNNCTSFYYIENVCVSLSEEDCAYLLNTSPTLSKSKIKIYPNPTSHHIYIEGIDQIADKIDIIDINGKSVLSAPSINFLNNKLDISTLSSGIYILKIYSNNHFSNHKILKQ